MPLRLFRLLKAEKTAGIELIESFAMWPESSVSGLYFSHPESYYFGVGKNERDQVEDYAGRKGWSTAEAERRQSPVLNYVPSSDAMPPLAPDTTVAVPATVILVIRPEEGEQRRGIIPQRRRVEDQLAISIQPGLMNPKSPSHGTAASAQYSAERRAE